MTTSLQLPRLSHLSLDGTKISGAGLAALAKLTKLEYLWLTNTDLSDGRVEDLGKLARLKELWLPSSSFTPTQIDMLKQALPNCGSGNENNERHLSNPATLAFIHPRPHIIPFAVDQVDGMLHPQQENVTPPSVKPRRLSFSLRTVFVIVTLLCVLMAWLAIVADRARRQERAVAKIGDLGGYIYFDYGREPDGSRMQVDNFELRDVHGDVSCHSQVLGAPPGCARLLVRNSTAP